MQFGTLASCALIMFGAMQLSAEAHIVTLEPDAYAAGTDVSNAWAHEGITLRSLLGNPEPTTAPVYSLSSDFRPAFTGSRTFGHQGSYGASTTWGAIADVPACSTDQSPGASCWQEYYSALHITFERPVDFVEAFGVWSIDWIGMILLGADGQRLPPIYAGHQQIYTDGVWVYGSTQVQRESRDIYGVILGGVIGGSSVDMIRVNVPEPGALALLTVGLLGIALTRRVNLQPSTPTRQSLNTRAISGAAHG